RTGIGFEPRRVSVAAARKPVPRVPPNQVRGYPGYDTRIHVARVRPQAAPGGAKCATTPSPCGARKPAPRVPPDQVRGYPGYDTRSHVARVRPKAAPGGADGPRGIRLAA